MQTVKVDKGVTSTVNAVFNEDVGTLVSKGNDININKVISLPDSIDAPINQNNVIGNVDFTLNDEIIATVNLVSDSTVNKINLWTATGNIIHNWFNLCR